MPSRKRSHSQMAASEPEAGQERHERQEESLISKIRNTWEFAAVMQFIYMFGKVVKIDEDFDIEDFETECLRPGYSEKLEEIGLTLLKWISSHRGLNYDIWDEYTRRQYLAKAPHLNPYGDDEEPKKFRHFDIFLKLRVLHQLTVWTFWNPDRMRERMDEQREQEQTAWRVEELGYDADDRQYYVLDDNRLYRRTEPPLPPPPKTKPKANSKKAMAARRLARKRRRVEDSETPEVATDQEDSAAAAAAAASTVPGTPSGPDADTLGGFKWECLAITLSDYQAVVASFAKTRDPNERILVARLQDEVIPTIEAAEEKQRRKIERRERELLAMEKMAHAKRSSRIADKQEREKQERAAAEAERKHAAELAAARRDRDRQNQMENERKSRIMTREQRIRDREVRRILKAEELAEATAEQEHIARGSTGRGSERQLKERIARSQRELESLTNGASADEWYFDCSRCGLHGKNFDDGSHSVACDKCNVWQHSKCLGIAKAAAEKDDFRFICDDCRRKEADEDPTRPKILLKFPKAASSSPAPTSPALPERKATFVGAEFPVNNSTHTMPNLSPTQQNPFPAQPNGHLPSSSAFYSLPPPPFHQPQQLAPRPVYATASPSTANNNTASISKGWTPQAAYQTTINHQPVVPPQQQYMQQISSWQASSARPPPYTSSLATPAHAPTNGQTPAARLPSPVLNRPVMSPSQGNYDVSALAGIAHNVPSSHRLSNGVISPSKQPPALGAAVPRTSAAAGTGAIPQAHYSPSSHAPTVSRSPSQHSFSGLSPTKNRAPSPMQPPSDSSPLRTTSHGSPQHPVRARSVSGTPIFPPAEKFKPTPDQLSQEPMPTPSKQPTPSQLNEHGSPTRLNEHGSPTRVNEHGSDLGVAASTTANGAGN